MKSKIKNGIYETVRWTLHICRWAGFLPISGLTQDEVQLTRCTFKSPYSIVLFLSIALQVFWLIIEVYDNIISQFNIRKFTAFFFAIISFLFVILLLSFSKKFKKMITKIEQIEKSLPPLRKAKLAVRKTNIMMILLFSFGCLEHFMYIIYTVRITAKCYLQPDDSGMYLRSYFLYVYSWLFRYFPFSYTFSFMIRLLKFQLAFLWTFIDILIIVFSKYMVDRFHDFNRIMDLSIRNVTHNGMRRMPWLELQVYYTRLTRIVKIIDKSISVFLLLSFTSNLCYIAQQLFDLINTIYATKNIKKNECVLSLGNDWLANSALYISLAYLVTRTTLVSSLPARIHTLSRQPLQALHTVPYFAYNYDLQKFMDQVHYSTIGLSGLGFFYVTRGMMLSVTATLMTYELVLLQF